MNEPTQAEILLHRWLRSRRRSGKRTVYLFKRHTTDSDLWSGIVYAQHEYGAGYFASASRRRQT